jgi:hypothetical protein
MRIPNMSASRSQGRGAYLSRSRGTISTRSEDRVGSVNDLAEGERA